VKLANMTFGELEAPIVFGWIQTGHQLGAAVAAFGAGVVRQHTGTYLPSFVAAGVMGVIAAGVLLFSRKGSRGSTELQPTT
jgi:predicted MFS family arabinose efflux permease